MNRVVDVRAHNRAAWDNLAVAGDRWTLPVSSDEVARARAGDWSVVLTNSTSVPRAWFPADMRDVDLLALASGGGQQAPLFAAAGARVTLLDNSPQQLARDEMVAKRDGLAITTRQGLMDDLTAFPDASFDLVFHPCSIMFTPDARAVFREVARVLRAGGAYLAGFVSPLTYVFDMREADENHRLVARHKLPYSDALDMDKDELAARIARREPLEHSHTMGDLVGGQLDAGLRLAGFYEDKFGDAAYDEHFWGLFATRAIRVH